MNRLDKERACDALMDWFDSQGIDPVDGIEIMAMAMVCAVVTMVKCGRLDEPPTEGDIKRIGAAIDAAAKLLPLEFYRLCEGGSA